MGKLTLEEIAKKAKEHKPTAEERRAQRVSLVMGLRSFSSTLTQEKAESLLNEFEGHTQPSKGSSRE